MCKLQWRCAVTAVGGTGTPVAGCRSGVNHVLSKIRTVEQSVLMPQSRAICCGRTASTSSAACTRLMLPTAMHAAQCSGTPPATHPGFAVCGHDAPAGQAGGLEGAKRGLRGAVQLQLPRQVHSILEHHVGALACTPRGPIMHLGCLLQQRVGGTVLPHGSTRPLGASRGGAGQTLRRRGTQHRSPTYLPALMQTAACRVLARATDELTSMCAKWRADDRRKRKKKKGLERLRSSIIEAPYHTHPSRDGGARRVSSTNKPS
jgi:hypothetical protein